MSRKRSADEISDAIDALVGIRAAPAKPKRPMTEAAKARLREYSRQKRAAKTIARREGIIASVPMAQAMFDAYPYKKGSRAKDLNKAGPYARSLATYRPLKNDWPGVDDIGVGGAGALRVHVPRKYLAARYASGERTKRQPTQRQLEALARGRAIRAANLGR